ncbi:MAG: hypothetical protein IID55_14160 [Proteobacteria bacterium]|nr:hypothetical protein [Pseudomonadota bacterium]
MASARQRRHDSLPGSSPGPRHDYFHGAILAGCAEVCTRFVRRLGFGDAYIWDHGILAFLFVFNALIDFVWQKLGRADGDLEAVLQGGPIIQL